MLWDDYHFGRVRRIWDSDQAWSAFPKKGLPCPKKELPTLDPSPPMLAIRRSARLPMTHGLLLQLTTRISRIGIAGANVASNADSGATSPAPPNSDSDRFVKGVLGSVLGYGKVTAGVNIVVAGTGFERSMPDFRAAIVVDTGIPKWYDVDLQVHSSHSSDLMDLGISTCRPESGDASLDPVEDVFWQPLASIFHWPWVSGDGLPAFPSGFGVCSDSRSCEFRSRSEYVRRPAGMVLPWTRLSCARGWVASWIHSVQERGSIYVSGDQNSDESDPGVRPYWFSITVGLGILVGMSMVGFFSTAMVVSLTDYNGQMSSSMG